MLILPILPNYKCILLKKENGHSVSHLLKSKEMNYIYKKKADTYSPYTTWVWFYINTVQLKLSKYSSTSIWLYLCCWCIGGNCVPKATKKLDKNEKKILRSHIFNNTISSNNSKVFCWHTNNTLRIRILKPTLTLGKRVSKRADFYW